MGDSLKNGDFCSNLRLNPAFLECMSSYALNFEIYLYR